MANYNESLLALAMEIYAKFKLQNARPRLISLRFYLLI